MKDESNKFPMTGEKIGRPAKLSRRSLLRAGATAMPVVLTLQSGAALARSSNLISAAPGATDGDEVLCLNTTYASYYDGGKYDLGYMPTDLTRLRTGADVTYHPLVPGGRSDKMGITAQQFCEAGGSYEIKLEPGWCQVDLPTNNIIVSSVALHSVGTRIKIIDNTLC